MINVRIITSIHLSTQTVKKNVDDKIDPDKEYFNTINVNCDYHTHSKFLDNVTKVNGFSMVHFNCRSIRKNFDNMVGVLNDSKYNFDIIAISETWEDSDDCSDKYVIDEYDSFLVSRKYKTEGGVAIFAKKSLNAKMLDHGSFSVNEIIDCLSIEIENNEKKVIISCVYRPPNRNILDFMSHIEVLLEKYRNKTLFIAGDMNINILNYNNHDDTNEFLNLMYSKGLYPLITKPTRITRKSATLIDNIFTNECHSINKSGLLVCDVSDHLPVFQICNYDSVKENKNNKFTYKRCLDEESVKMFVGKVSNIDWNSVILESNPNVAYDRFLHEICCIYDECCPTKRVKLNNKKDTKPWLTPGLINATKKKRLLYEQSLKYGTVEAEKNIGHIKIN